MGMSRPVSRPESFHNTRSSRIDSAGLVRPPNPAPLIGPFDESDQAARMGHRYRGAKSPWVRATRRSRARPHGREPRSGELLRGGRFREPTTPLAGTLEGVNPAAGRADSGINLLVTGRFPLRSLRSAFRLNGDPQARPLDKQRAYPFAAEGLLAQGSLMGPLRDSPRPLLIAQGADVGSGIAWQRGIKQHSAIGLDSSSARSRGNRVRERRKPSPHGSPRRIAQLVLCPAVNRVQEDVGRLHEHRGFVAASNRAVPTLPEVTGLLLRSVPHPRARLLPKLVKPAEVRQARSPLGDPCRILDGGPYDLVRVASRDTARTREPTPGDLLVGPRHREFRLGSQQKMYMIPHHGEVAYIDREGPRETLEPTDDPLAPLRGFDERLLPHAARNAVINPAHERIHLLSPWIAHRLLLAAILQDSRTRRCLDPRTGGR
jgi:hypothetical protein